MARRIRTFIAAGLDRTVRDRTVALQEKLAEADVPVNWVEPDNLHVTLLFLGEVDERDLIKVCRAVETVCRGHAPFTMNVGTTGAFPNARRPKILWAGIGAGAEELTAIHDALEAPLLELGCYRREDRPYSPHLTLGRVKGDEGTEPLAATLARNAGWHGGEVPVREVLVMSSELGRDGPVYSVMSRAKLLGEGGEQDPA
jgi:2'-5' RNA ligase